MNALKPLSCFIFAVLTLAGCGGKGEGTKSSSQVAVKVNSGEISVHQINYVLQRTPGIASDRLEEAKKKVLESLVDQELVVQQAIDAKLDRNPDVLQSLEAVRREVLARAYLDQQIANKGRPTANDVRQYFVSHPELFSARKIYRLEERSFSASPDVTRAVRDLIANSRSSSEIVTFLKAKGIDTAGGVTVKPAEQLPLELLPKLAQQKDGQPHLYEDGDRATIVTVLATKSEPLTQVQAAPVIEQFLVNQMKADQTRDLVKQLRDKAKIEYMGEFGVSKPPVQAGTPGAKSGAKLQDATVISKGVAGLK